MLGVVVNDVVAPGHARASIRAARRAEALNDGLPPSPSAVILVGALSKSTNMKAMVAQRSGAVLLAARAMQ